MTHRLFCLLLITTPIIAYGQITGNEKITTVSFAITGSTLEDANTSSFGLNTGLSITGIHARKLILGKRRYRLTTTVEFEGNQANSGLAGSYGISHISRFHQIVLSSGLRLASIPSLFAQLQLFAFPFKRIGILGISTRVHLKLRQKETFGRTDLAITLFSTRKYK